MYTAGTWRAAVATVLIALVLTGCGGAVEPASPLPVVSPQAAAAAAAAPTVCGLWMAIGDEPTDDQLVDAARRYPVVVLNAWEIAAQRRLRALNPAVTVLVYKDLSSTRNYDGVDAHGGLLPAGLDFARTGATNPQWFATDTSGDRIEWGPFPGHWQMAVWDRGYQQAWARAVTAETVRDGWDGVLADNDFADLGFYSDAVLAGTSGPDATNQRIRDGLDGMVGTAGTALAAEGKLLIPNLSEARRFPGRWTSHARFGGAMEENFAQNVDGTLLTWEGAQWAEMLRTGSDARHLNLLVTKTSDVPRDRRDATERAGFAGAALLAGDRTCWTAAPAGDYSRPGRSDYQSLPLGSPGDPAARDPESGVWTRAFTGGWVALNPTGSDATVTPPSGLRTPDGEEVSGPVTVGAADGLVLLR